MFGTFLNNLRAACVAAIVANGGKQADAETFVGSIGDGTLLQMILAFFQNPSNLAGLEGFITFIMGLFTAFGQLSTPAAITALVAKFKPTVAPAKAA
jgi:hypothetical protein